jgi:hypothetical protein
MVVPGGQIRWEEPLSHRGIATYFGGSTQTQRQVPTDVKPAGGHRRQPVGTRAWPLASKHLLEKTRDPKRIEDLSKTIEAQRQAVGRDLIHWQETYAGRQSRAR